MGFSFSATYVALWSLAIFQGLLILSLLQQLTKIRALAEGTKPIGDWLPVGYAAPGFESADQLKNGWGHLDPSELVVLFLSAGCAACQELLNDIGRRSHTVPQILAVCQGGNACAKVVAQLASNIPLVVGEGEQTARQYHVSRFPTAVVVDRERKIRGYGHPSNAAELERIFRDSLGEIAATAPHAVASSSR